MLQTFTIYGTVSGNLQGVVMSGLPNNPQTDSAGFYTDTVEYGWSGTVTPTLAGYDFSPSSTTYPDVSSNQVTNYTATLLTYTITASVIGNGSITPSGTVTVDHGANQTFTITPDANHHIADVVVDGGSVGTPSSYEFTNVTENHTIEASFAIDTYTISGTVTVGGSGLQGVVMSGLPGTPTPTTDVNGDYSGTVDYGWSGTVTPTLAGYYFSPPDRIYTDVSSDQANQDYAAYLTLVGVDGYIMPLDDGTGRYRIAFATDGVLTGGGFCCANSVEEARAAYPAKNLAWIKTSVNPGAGKIPELVGVDGYIVQLDDGTGRYIVRFANDGVLTGGVYCCPSSVADARAAYPAKNLVWIK
jgi:hypothetical protein